ncbi:hypothetical protein GCM10010994_32100 [Chelatococcus reniformis]|uniref:Uncharacterized protein n=1 Tax=Chelatococcus reniformis TaxID=1494448 RepID=A0A916UFM4_9HYPH|nr:hypothetical protein GCM10010994_32100 [Chelatococcus reniformis]
MLKLLSTCAVLTLLTACQSASSGRQLAGLTPAQIKAAQAQDAATAQAEFARCDASSTSILEVTKCKAAVRERYIIPYASPQEQRISRILVSQNIGLAEKIARGEITEAQARSQYAAIVRTVMAQEGQR